MNKYAEAVKKGAAMLDAKIPGWIDMIDLANLEMSLNRGCILGQIAKVYGLPNGYWSGLDILGISDIKATGIFKLPFTLWGRTEEYEVLGNAWKDLILQRLSSQQSTETTKT